MAGKHRGKEVFFMMQGRHSEIDYGRLRDIQSVKIDPSLPRKERVKSFLEQIGDPYCYLDGGTVVSVSYADTSASLEDRLRSYVNTLM